MKYGLIGNPIDESPSPVMHNAAFDAIKMNAEYLLRPAGPDDAQAVCSEIQYGKWLGLNVTTPMKTVMGSLVTLEGHAKRAGAVNTLWRYGADIHGALTDVDGIMKPLEQREIKPGGYALILPGAILTPVSFYVSIVTMRVLGSFVFYAEHGASAD